MLMNVLKNSKCPNNNGAVDKMSKVNFSPAETLYSTHYLFIIYFLHVPQILNSCGINFGNVFKRLRP